MRSFARFNVKDMFHPVGDVIEVEIKRVDICREEVGEYNDHVVWEGVEEDGAGFHGGNGWFPQKFEVI